MHKRHRLLTLSAIALFVWMSGFAQSPGIEWQRPLGGTSTDIWRQTIQTSDQHLLVAGNSSHSGTGNDIYLSKISLDGRIIWSKVLGGSADEDLYNIYNAPDGGFIIAATTSSGNGDVVGFHGGSDPDAWIIKLSASGAIEWQKCIGGNRLDNLIGCAVQADGSFILSGRTNSSDGEFLGNDGTDKAYVVKLSNTGNIIFKQFTGAGPTAPQKMLVKSNGNVLVAGTNYRAGFTDVFVAEINTSGNVTWFHRFGGAAAETFFDMIQTGSGKYTVLTTTGSSDGDVTGYHGDADIWIFTIDDSGNIIWKKAIGGTKSEDRPTISFMAADSSMILSASTMSSDGDMTGNHGGTDVWVGKLSNSGNILWKRCLGGSNNEDVEQVQVNAAGQAFLSTQTTSNDGDVSGYHGGKDLWFVKLTADGSLDWQKCLGGSLDEDLSNFSLDEDGITILAATPSNDGDVQGMHYHSDTSVFPNYTYIYYNNDIWLVKLNSSGALNWQRSLGGFGNELPGNVFGINGKYFVSGGTASNNGDVSGLQGSSDMWLVKLGEANIIEGTVFFDLNSNGIKDANESFYDQAIVKSEKNNYRRWSIPYNGRFKNEVDTGQLTTSISLMNPYFTVVPVSKTSSFTHYFSVDSVDFALQPLPGKRDVSVDIIPVSGARPGLNSSYRLYYKNMGTDTVASGKVYMLKDTNTVFVNATPSPDQIKGDTLIWNYTNLQPTQSASITVTLGIAAPPKVNAGDKLAHQVIIDSTNDLTPANNRDTLKQVVTGSYDPNEKSENHAGFIALSGITGGDYLTYVINFQNLGTDTAFTIVVRDTLDSQLDWNTLQMIGASHAWSLQVNEGNKCTWSFANILLPHSAINEPASHGYIAYRIKPKSTLSVGSIVNNKASIYFDYNLPVVTNTATTLVQPEPVAQPVISGMANSYCSSQPIQQIKIINLPDNATTTVVKLDNTVLPVAPDSSFTFALSALTAGAHTITVTYSNTADSKTTSANFTVTVAAKPEVNVSANITQVTNPADPVIITAINAAGGGKSPLYTFAWNRNFTNLIQAEGSSNTLTIPPLSLTIGDNQIYVRMKTSEICYTTQTNTDSIIIRRDQATGITDIDNPGQIINAYPNPFSGAITIQGLSTAKTYTFRIYSLQGHLLYTKQVNNHNIIIIPGLHYARGTYWLSIYDEKKKKSLGTIPLIKQ